MTSAARSWLEGAGVRPYVLDGAEIAVRLLLPARTSREEPTTWAAVTQDSGHPEPIGASTSWTRLTELDGRGEGPAALVEHPGGRLSAPLLAALVAALTSVTGPGARWHYEENPERAGTSVELAPPGREGPPTTYGPTTLHGSVAELAQQWDLHGFHGRAWDDAATVGLAADSYADSIILSGPAHLSSILTDTRLEAFEMSVGGPNPMTTS